MKRPKDSTVASVCVYHTNENGPHMRNAWGLFDAVQDGKIKPGEFIVAKIVGGNEPEGKAHIIACIMERLNKMTIEQLTDLLANQTDG